MARNPASRIILTWLVTGVTDFVFSSVLTVAFYGSTVTRLFQGVASVLIGPRAIQGGTSTAMIGILMHFGVALVWTAFFALVALRSSVIRDLAASRFGVVKTAALYGPFIWLVMSLVVIPLLTGRPPAITLRWLVQLLGHIPAVALPIVAMTTARLTPRAAASPDRATARAARESR
jgi:hypothetical protein